MLIPRFDRSRHSGCGGVSIGAVAGFAGAFDPVEDGAELALQSDVELATPIAGREDDAVDHLAQRVGGFDRVVAMAEDQEGSCRSSSEASAETALIAPVAMNAAW